MTSRKPAYHTRSETQDERELAHCPPLFMQIVEDERTVLFNDGAPDMIAPGILAGIAASRRIIRGNLRIILCIQAKAGYGSTPNPNANNPGEK